MTLKRIRLFKVAVGKREKVVLGFVAKLGISKEIEYRNLGRTASFAPLLSTCWICMCSRQGQPSIEAWLDEATA
jgi:hypothetical protein